MATVITSECINCGACEPECPNTAIYQGGVEWQAPTGRCMRRSPTTSSTSSRKCTECVGFYDQEACAKVCRSTAACPTRAAGERGVLLERARALHPDKTIPDDSPSRFKKEAPPRPPCPDNGHDVAAAAPSPPPRPLEAVAACAGGSRSGREAARAPRPARSFAGELAGRLRSALGRARLAAPPAPLALAVLPLALLAAGRVSSARSACARRSASTPPSPTVASSTPARHRANVFLNLVLYPVGVWCSR